MKAIVTVVGLDKPGIIAKVCTYLTAQTINVLDINQTIMQGYFNMMMMVELENATQPLSVLSSELDDLAQELDVIITIQRESIFTAMHRL